MFTIIKINGYTYVCALSHGQVISKDKRINMIA